MNNNEAKKNKGDKIMQENSIRHGKVYMWNGMILFIGTVNDTAIHRHHALQLVLGLDGSFIIHTETESIVTNAVFIDSDINHRLSGTASTQALFLIESGSETTSRLKPILKNRGILNFSDDVWSKKAISVFQKCIMVNSNIDQISEAVINLLNTVFQISIEAQPFDPRILKARTLIDNLEKKKISANQIATTLSLSETRFIHLFRQETGIPFRRYVLWKRLMDSIKVILDTGDITQAAHEAGFSDSAHLARTFKVNFGIILSDIFKNDRFVQVIISTFK